VSAWYITILAMVFTILTITYIFSEVKSQLLTLM